MNVTLVAGRYAKALFDLAVEKNLADEIFNDSQLIARTCEESRELRLLLKSPIINSGKKLAIINAIYGNNIQPLTLTYLQIMIRKGREGILPEIAAHVIDLYNAYRNLLTVHFRSPVAPDETTRKKVIEMMMQYTEADIDLKSEIDESLIGGFVLNWEDKQYDASIRREIENMRAAMAKVNLYKKGY